MIHPEDMVNLTQVRRELILRCSSLSVELQEIEVRPFELERRQLESAEAVAPAEVTRMLAALQVAIALARALVVAEVVFVKDPYAAAANGIEVTAACTTNASTVTVNAGMACGERRATPGAAGGRAQ